MSKQLDFAQTYQKILCFDCETTGFSWIKNQIIEIGFVLKSFSTKTNRYENELTGSWLVKADAPLPQKIIEITKITDKMLEEDGFERDRFDEKLMELFEDDSVVLMGYNVPFDLNFVQEELRKHLKNPKFVLNHRVIDVLTIYRDRFVKPHKLVVAIKKMDAQGINSHRALDDALATYEVFRKLMKQNFNPVAYINRIGTYGGVKGHIFTQVKYIKQGLYGGEPVYRDYLDYLKGIGENIE